MRSTGCAPRTLRVARGWLRCPARPRGVTFFQPQTQLLQQMPDPTQAERNARLTMQLGLQLSQRQIGFRCHPIHHLSLRRDTGTPLAPGLVPHPLGLPGAVPLCGDLLRPAHAHQEPIRKFLQRLLALIVSKQKLTAQVIPLWLRHRFTRRGSSPRQVYTIKENALVGPQKPQNQCRALAPANLVPPLKPFSAACSTPRVKLVERSRPLGPERNSSADSPSVPHFPAACSAVPKAHQKLWRIRMQDRFARPRPALIPPHSQPNLLRDSRIFAFCSPTTSGEICLEPESEQ